VTGVANGVGRTGPKYAVYSERKFYRIDVEMTVREGRELQLYLERGE
jgi:hypothetical protein